ncbi:hypothetical protein F2Q69_00002421 [Brassica cretica]|uniref:Uncharacterized protein n=2 Tax=Brassica TaxID=3705 RepID=A0A8S9P3G3_BRACR|nr:hypothetical protein F2Q69_00002421 [Brassica cretica]
MASSQSPDGDMGSGMCWNGFFPFRRSFGTPQLARILMKVLQMVWQFQRSLRSRKNKRQFGRDYESDTIRRARYGYEVDKETRSGRGRRGRAVCAEVRRVGGEAGPWAPNKCLDIDFEITDFDPNTNQLQILENHQVRNNSPQRGNNFDVISVNSRTTVLDASWENSEEIRGEAQALLMDVQQLRRLGYKQITFLNDCRPLVDEWNQFVFDSSIKAVRGSEISSMVQDILENSKCNRPFNISLGI